MNRTLVSEMTEIAISGPGGPEVLQPRRGVVPAPKDGEVLIRVAYAGVNRHDCNQRRRGHGPPGATPTPGLEISGEIVEIGGTSNAFSIGAQVCALVNGGGYAEYCIARTDVTFLLPPGLSLEAAAALPEALFTVWLNIVQAGRLERGESLLIHGGTSGVGSIGIQVAHLLGAHVLVTAGSPEKCAAALKLGADVAINYRDSDFVADVHRATNGAGVNVILDMVGTSYAQRNLDALAYDGRISYIAPGPDPALSIQLPSLMQKRASITGSLLRPLPDDRKAGIAHELRTRIWPFLGSEIVPLIDSVFPLAAANEAHQRMESGLHSGKLLLRALEPAA